MQKTWGLLLSRYKEILAVSVAVSGEQGDSGPTRRGGYDQEMCALRCS